MKRRIYIKLFLLSGVVLFFSAFTVPSWADDDALSLDMLGSVIQDTKISIGDQNQCEAMRKSIVDKKDIVRIEPVISMDEYDQHKFDKFLGKCKGHNITYLAFSEHDMHAVRDYKLYRGYFFENSKISLILFARDWLQMDFGEEYSSFDDFRSNHPVGGDAFDAYAYLNTRICKAVGYGDYVRSQSGAPAHAIDKTAIFKINRKYYSIDYADKQRFEPKKTITISNIEKAGATYVCVFSN